jgi:hypothetical protein
MLHGVPFDRVETVWPVVQPMLQKAVDASQQDCGMEDIYFALLSRDMQLWTWVEDGAITAIFVTAIHNYPNRRVCQIPYIAGKGVHQWYPVVEQALSEWAKSRGCSQLEGFCREGWLKILKNWRKAWITMRKDI